MMSLFLALFACTGEPTKVDSPVLDTGDSVDSARDSVETDSGSIETGDTDTGVVDTDPIETGETADTDNGDECADGYDVDHDDTPAEPCDPTLRWVDVSAGMFMTCGVKEDGCAECWGNLPNYLVVPDVPLQRVSLSNKSNGTTLQHPHVCGLTVDAEIKCWGGDNGYGDNDAPAGTYISLATGDENAVAVREDGRLEHWGYLDACLDGPYVSVATSGNDNAAVREDGTLEVFFTTEAVVTVEGSWSTVSHGGAWVCGLRSDLDGAAQCVSSVDGSEDPPWFGDEPAGSFESLCVSQAGACALDSAGTPTCWPEGAFGASPPAGPFTSVTCGYQHACGLTPEGTIECWGYGDYGETTPPS